VRVLILSRNYPNPALPTLGLWVARLAQVARGIADVTVVAPVPWTPPGMPAPRLRALRAVPRRREDGGIEIRHPRIPVGPGYWLHPLDARMQYPFVRRVAERLHRARPFDLIHAHFIYPDGVMAARLGRILSIPVMTTEHALWQPWLDDWPRVRRQVLAALGDIALVTAVSESVRKSIEAVAGDRVTTAVLPNVVDENVFRAPALEERYDPNQILFVGAVRHVKGLDVLVRAMARLAPKYPNLRLQVLGEAFYGQWRRDEAEVRRLTRELGLTERITFAGRTDPAEVAATMRSSAVLVVPARRESFSAVAIEALASGTPVVATRCGGPEEILTDDLGRLVPTEDPAALAAALEDVMHNRRRFDPARLRESAVRRFGLAATKTRLVSLYEAVLAAHRPAADSGISAR
jgi:teichuronic acid biosynthesis glycosyltransferase TuaC